MIRRLKIGWPGTLVIVGMIALIFAIILPSIHRLRQTRGIVPCASNMRVIGQALLLYSQSHGGRYPQRLDKLLGYAWSPSKDRLVCAVSGKPAVFVAPAAVAAHLTAADVV